MVRVLWVVLSESQVEIVALQIMVPLSFWPPQPPSQPLWSLAMNGTPSWPSGTRSRLSGAPDGGIIERTALTLTSRRRTTSAALRLPGAWRSFWGFCISVAVLYFEEFVVCFRLFFSFFFPQERRTFRLFFPQTRSRSATERFLSIRNRKALRSRCWPEGKRAQNVKDICVFLFYLAHFSRNRTCHVAFVAISWPIKSRRGHNDRFKFSSHFIK